MLLVEVARVSSTVSRTTKRNEKVAEIAALLSRLSVDEAPIVISFLMGEPRQARLGVGYASMSQIDAEPAATARLTVFDVDQILTQLTEVSGPGSQEVRRGLLESLFERSTVDEQSFLRGLILRNLRQGALEGLMAEAVASSLGVDPERVRRAAMLEGDLVEVASKALADGVGSLRSSGLDLLTPVKPMLARTAPTAAEAVSGVGDAFVEQKLDGARIQVHRLGDRVRIFTRNLRDVTRELSDIAASVTALAGDSFLLDGEALLFGSDGAPMSFQDSMSRFGEEQSRPEVPLAAVFFDCLHLDGRDLVDEPLIERRRALESLVPDEALVEGIRTSDPQAANEYFAKSVAAGFEGVVVKQADQPYQAGRRGSAWVKVKPVYTLDLVILAAEWGSGRRRGWLSNLHLGARDGDDLVMLGKTFKGLTDEMLAWQTDTFLALEKGRDGRIVHLRPEIVYEIAFDGVQRSSRYPGGVALRFARVKGYRADKGPGEADTLETVRRFLR